MATPYSNVGTGTRDDYNFYHSQLRINIECSFGYLVNRWRLLRKPFAASTSIERINATVMCLCRLHNWCIDNNAIRTIPSPLSNDPRSILDIDNSNSQIPIALLHGGEHFEDSETIRNAQYVTNRQDNTIVLPRELLHDHIVTLGYTRPTLHNC